MISTYVLFRALEFGWNCAEQIGLVWGWEKRGEGEPWRMRERPAWFGSWLMAPFACGQLFWTLVFEREIFPEVGYSSTLFGFHPSLERDES